MINALDLFRSPATDPTSIYRYRDGLYAADLLTAAISHLDSSLLMTISEGKCYSEKEMADFLTQAGFSCVAYFPTAADRSVITARK